VQSQFGDALAGCPALGGAGALHVRFSPGRPAKLSASERKRLIRLLLKGPAAQGYRTHLWSTARIAEMVEREFGVATIRTISGA